MTVADIQDQAGAETFDPRATLALRHLETASRYLLTNLLPLPLVVIGLGVLLTMWHPEQPIVIWAAVTILTWSITILILHRFLNNETRGEALVAWRVAICVSVFISASAFVAAGPLF